jgi:hypothetical protein
MLLDDHLAISGLNLIVKTYSDENIAFCSLHRVELKTFFLEM